MMLNNPQTAGNLPNQPFIAGTPVFDTVGEKVGTLKEYNQQGGYLLVEKGWLFRQDVYIPLNAIGAQEVNGIYLNLSKDVLQAQDWNTPPTYGSAFTGTPSMSSTAPDLPPTPPDAGVGAQATSTQEGDVRVPLREEELVVGKQQQEAGRLHLHKDVVEEQQTATAPVTHEEVTVERVPTQGQPGDLGPDAFTEQDIDVPVMGEQLVAGKRATIGEEARIHKQPVTEQQQVGDTVQKERLEIEQSGNLEQEGDIQSQP